MKHIDISNLSNINNLTELLEVGKHFEFPVLIRLSNQEGDNNYLVDRVVESVIEASVTQIEYEKLSTELSHTIKGELRVVKNPILLLLQRGEIKSIFQGMVAQFQIEKALQDLQ